MILGLALVLTGTWISSRDDIRDTREPGTVLTVPALTPYPKTEEQAVKPSDSHDEPAETPTVKSGSVSGKTGNGRGKYIPGLPLELAVPRLGVDAAVQQLGTASDDTQLVPDNYTDVSWWKDGRMPGQNGNAVFAGHTYSGGNGVFDRLLQLNSGDLVKVKTTEGVQRYRVGSVRKVPLEEYDRIKHDIYRWDGPSGIVLLTCGDWNGDGYDSTVVVTARPAE